MITLHITIGELPLEVSAYIQPSEPENGIHSPEITITRTKNIQGK